MNKIWNFTAYLTELMIQLFKNSSLTSKIKQFESKSVSKKILMLCIKLDIMNISHIIILLQQMKKQKNQKNQKKGKSEYQGINLVFQQLLKIRKSRERDIKIIRSLKNVKIKILKGNKKKVEIRSISSLNRIIFHLVLASRSNSQAHNHYYQNSMYQLRQVTKRLGGKKVGKKLSKKIQRQSRKKIFFINLLRKYDEIKVQKDRQIYNKLHPRWITNKKDIMKMNTQDCQFYNQNINFCQIWISKIDEKLQPIKNKFKKEIEEEQNKILRRREQKMRDNNQKTIKRRKIDIKKREYDQQNKELIKLLKKFEKQLPDKEQREQREQQSEQIEQREQKEQIEQREQREQTEDKIEENQNKLRQFNKEIICNQNPEDYNKPMESLIDWQQQNQIFKTQSNDDIFIAYNQYDYENNQMDLFRVE